ncbi:hypothetical protein D3C78_1902600 [compost metagenome]
MRVFVNRDFDYGYFIDESVLFGLLTPEQQAAYLATEDVLLEVEPDIAQKVIDMGKTVYKTKPRVI